MAWGTHRRNVILSIFFSVVAVFLAIYLFNALYEPPNCFDNKQNGGETGVDCGGSCELMCSNQVISPIVHWRRLFEVAPGVYNVLAYVENPNPTAGVDAVPYRFGIYDDQNVLLQERRGIIKLPPKTIVPIMENTLASGQLDASRVSFTFTEDLVWKKRDPLEPVVVVQDEEILNEEDAPRIQAVLRNTDLVALRNVRVIVIVYDRDDNAIAASSTLLERIGPDSTAPIFFTWPQPFSDDISRFEIIPVYERTNR